MAVCARVVNYTGADMGAGPVQVLVLDPSAADLSKCQYVVSSGAELANSLFSLTAEDGAYVSSAIIGCWVAAYLVRSVINVIKGSTEA
jgi:hypothetical protein